MKFFKIVEFLAAVAIVAVLATACSSEAYDPNDMEDQRKSSSVPTTPANKSSDQRISTASTVPGTNNLPQPTTPPSLPSAAPQPASAPPAPAPPPAPPPAVEPPAHCARIGCYIDQSNAHALHVYGKFDTDNDGCLNKQEATAYAHEKCLTTKRPISFLTCPINKDNQPVRGAWQALCYFKDVTSCDCEVLP